jgi:hypothetical protein
MREEGERNRCFHTRLGPASGMWIPTPAPFLPSCGSHAHTYRSCVRHSRRRTSTHTLAHTRTLVYTVGMRKLTITHTQIPSHTCSHTRPPSRPRLFLLFRMKTRWTRGPLPPPGKSPLPKPTPPHIQGRIKRWRTERGPGRGKARP